MFSVFHEKYKHISTISDGIFVLPAKKGCRKMYDSYKTESVCRGISVIPRQLLQQPPCYCLQLFLWLRKGLAPFYTVRFCVAFFHKQTFLRAG